MVKYLSFHNSSFALRYFFNANGKAIVWYTPLFAKRSVTLHVKIRNGFLGCFQPFLNCVESALSGRFSLSGLIESAPTHTSKFYINILHLFSHSAPLKIQRVATLGLIPAWNAALLVRLSLKGLPLVGWPHGLARRQFPPALF
jgi:hypothetical protein